jgi:hypothetical protein
MVPFCHRSHQLLVEIGKQAVRRPVVVPVATGDRIMFAEFLVTKINHRGNLAPFAEMVASAVKDSFSPAITSS